MTSALPTLHLPLQSTLRGGQNRSECSAPFEAAQDGRKTTLRIVRLIYSSGAMIGPTETLKAF